MCCCAGVLCVIVQGIDVLFISSFVFTDRYFRQHVNQIIHRYLAMSDLHSLVNAGDARGVKRALEDPGVDVNQLDDSGATPLDYAAKRETEETADFLRKRDGKTSTELREERKKLAD